MNWDLDRSFAEICTSLPKDARSRIVFTASSFASCLGRIETDRLALTKCTHDYGSGYRADLIRFRAKRTTFQELGLLIRAVVFRPGGQTRIVLSHPESDIENLGISYSGSTARPSGHKTKPDQFSFSPEKIENIRERAGEANTGPCPAFPALP
jgi:hypothetical protein